MTNIYNILKNKEDDFLVIYILGYILFISTNGIFTPDFLLNLYIFIL